MEQTLIAELQDKVNPILTAKGVELVELKLVRESGRTVLKFFVDKDGGITLGECAQLNKEIGQFLDQQDSIQQRYVLEVSSPGLDRPLKSTRDFQRCLNQPVKVVLHQAYAGQNVWIGVLTGVDEQNLTIQTEAEQQVTVPRNIIARARLEVHA
ncbi:ribosome maturation factor RimP [Candidatus Omnitrophota bacterium]